MRRTASPFPLTALAVLAVAFAACGKKGDTAAADGNAADTSTAVTTKAADTKTVPAAPAPVPSRPAAPAAAAMPVAGGKVDPGMTKAQVVALFGKPSSDRTRGDFTYLLFSNGMEKQVGMSDLVVLQGDKVVDAVLRAPNRSYSGTSSSPRAIPADEAAKKNAASSNGTGPQP